MANGTVHQFGTLYVNNVKIALPTSPWSTESTVVGAPSTGNILNYEDASYGDIEIRNTDTDNAYKIKWVEVNDGYKKLFISDRCLITGISWDDISYMNLVDGKDITIDGVQYVIRLMTCGTSIRNDDEYAGANPVSNEWDRIINNEGSIPGLPKPTASELDSTINASDYNSAHNKLWNWYGMLTWGKDKYSKNDRDGILRGFTSSRDTLHVMSAAEVVVAGWRPILELKDYIPNKVPIEKPTVNDSLDKLSLFAEEQNKEIDYQNFRLFSYLKSIGISVDDAHKNKLSKLIDKISNISVEKHNNIPDFFNPHDIWIDGVNTPTDTGGNGYNTIRYKDALYDFVTFDKVFKYDLKTHTWIRLTGRTKRKRNSCSTMVQYKNRVYFLGGSYYNGSVVYVGESDYYDMDTDTWTNIIDSPYGIGDYGGFVDGNAIFIPKGTGTNDPALRYNIETNTWTTLSSPGTVFEGGFMYKHRDIIYYIGGSNYGERILRYNVVRNSWLNTLYMPNVGQADCYFYGEWYGTNLLLFGSRGHVIAFEPNTETFVTKTRYNGYASYPWRINTLMYKIGDLFYIPHPYYNTNSGLMATYNASTNTWTNKAALGFPINYSSMFYMDSGYLLIYGGYSNSSSVEYKWRNKMIAYLI